MVEYRDLYDDNKNLIGQTIKKGDSFSHLGNIIVVLVFIQNSKGEFLIQFTSKEKNSVFGTTGGHPKAGETSLEGIMTEIKEELGLLVNKDEVIYFDTKLMKNRFLDLYYIKKDIDINDLTLQKEEVEYVKWMSLEEINNLIDNNLFIESHSIFFNKIINNEYDVIRIK